MRTRRLGKTDLTVSELGLGTWGLSGDGYGPVAEPEQDQVIDRALTLGIRLFETSDAYDRGAMEKRLGERLPAGDSVCVVTRIGTDREVHPPRKRFDRAYLEAAFEKSRARLRRDVVDVVLLHNPVLETMRSAEAADTLEALKARGVVRAWGVSAGAVDVARAAIEKGAAVLSLQYHALFSSDLAALEEDITKNDVGVLARSVLAHGLLTGYWSLQRGFAHGDHRADRWTADDLRRRIMQLPALRSLVGGDIPTMRSVALRFALSNEHVSSVLLGPRNVIQLDQLVRESGREPPYLTPAQLDKLRFRLAQIGVRS